MKFSAVLTALILFSAWGLYGIFFKTPDFDKTSVKFSSWGSKSETAVIKNLLAEFEAENPDIKINFIHIPENYFQKLHLMAASGLEPDVMFFNNQNIQMYINAGLLENLTPYFDNIENDFYSEALNCFRKNGRLYAVPRDISNLVIYYNKDIFKKNNVKIPEKIKDIYELRELALKTSSKENFGINFEDNPLFWLYYLSSNGGGAVSSDGKQIIINKPESLEALNLYADMINKDNVIPSKAQQGSLTSAQMFMKGRLAMYLSGRWITPKFRSVIKFDWDTAEFPAPNPVYIDASGFAVSKKSKNKKEAVKLIKFLSSPRSLSIAAESGLIIPALKKAHFQNENEKPENYQVFTSMLKNAKPSPVSENYALVMSAVKEKAESIFNGRKRAEDVFDEKTAAKLQKILDGD